MSDVYIIKRRDQALARTGDAQKHMLVAEVFKNRCVIRDKDGLPFIVTAWYRALGTTEDFDRARQAEVELVRDLSREWSRRLPNVPMSEAVYE